MRDAVTRDQTYFLLHVAKHNDSDESMPISSQDFKGEALYC